MPRRPRTAEDRKRGRHRRSTSPETREWNRVYGTPPQPAWMSDTTYAALVALRHALELKEAA